MMTTSTAGNLTRYLRHMLRSWEHEERTDAELLALFVRDKDEQAFATLVRRFSVLVWGACYRILGHREEAEDAFQATFLVFARKAGQIRRKEVVGHWLYEVAQRTAQDVRKSLARRHRHEKQASTMLPTAYKDDVERPDLLAVLDEEIVQLPENYRLPLILCRLEGHTYAEAARSLGCSIAAVGRRVARAEELLRNRLTRRGVTLAGVSVAALLSQAVTAKGMPLCLVGDTIRAVQAFTNNTLAPNLTMSITEGVMRSMSSSKAAWWGAVFVTLIGATAGLVAQLTPKAQGVDLPAASASSSTPSKELRRDCYGDPVPPDALVRLGTVRLRHDARVQSLFFTPDGKRLLTAGGDNLPRLWEVATGELLREYRTVPKPQLIDNKWCDILGATLSPDGRLLAARGGHLSSLYLLETATGKRLHEFNGAPRNRSAWNFAFSPDSKTIAAQLLSSLELLDVTTGRPLWRKGETEIVGLAFSPDGKTLASAGGRSFDGVRLWDARTGELLRTVGLKERINRIAFSPDSRTLAVGYEQSPDREHESVYLWDMATGKEVRQLGEPGKPIASPVFSPDAKIVATGGEGAIRLWNVATGKELRRCSNTHSPPECPVAFSPDGKVLAALDGPLVRFWEVASGKALPSRLPTGHERDVTSIAFAPDGRTLISAGRDRTVRWWDARTGQQRLCLQGSESLPPLWGYPAAVLSPDRRRLATIYADVPDGDEDLVEIIKRGRIGICIREAATGKELRRLDGNGKGPSVHLAFSPDGKVLAEVFFIGEGRIRLWDVTSGKPYEHELAGTCPMFSPDGSLLALLESSNKDPATVERTISFWEVATGKKVHSIRINECIQRLALSPDGKILATSSDKITLYPLSWDKPSAVHIGAPRLVDYAPHWAVTALAFSPDGRMLASNGGGGDHAIHLWETASGKERARFQGHSMAEISPSTTSLSFTADGCQLASGSTDGTILIWDVTGRGQGGGLRPAQLSDKELEELWADLGADDAERAGRAIWTLAAASDQAVPYLREQLRASAAPIKDRMSKVPQLLRDLDNDTFAVREKAQRKLEELGAIVEPALRQILAKSPSPESRRSLEQILRAVEVERQTPSGGTLRYVRAMEALEYIGTRRARQALKSLTVGAPVESSLTQEARITLERMEQRAELR